MRVYILYYAAVKFMGLHVLLSAGISLDIVLLLERQMGKVGKYYTALVIIKNRAEIKGSLTC
jgi:hypothetical protein